MEYKFPMLRKITQVLFVISTLVLSVIFLGIGLLGLLDFYESGELIIKSDRIDVFITIAVFVILGVALVCGVFILIIRRPFSRQICFTKDGIFHEHKNIFISWDDVKKINIVRLNHNSLLVISTTLDEKVKLRDVFKQKTSKQILLEWCENMHPILDEYWMGNLENYLGNENSYDIYLIFVICLEIVILIFFLGLFFVILQT